MEIRVETRQPHIVLVTIANEPRRNAMTRAMLADLAALWEVVASSERGAQRTRGALAQLGRAGGRAAVEA